MASGMAPQCLFIGILRFPFSETPTDVLRVSTSRLWPLDYHQRLYCKCLNRPWPRAGLVSLSPKICSTISQATDAAFVSRPFGPTDSTAAGISLCNGMSGEVGSMLDFIALAGGGEITPPIPPALGSPAGHSLAACSAGNGGSGHTVGVLVVGTNPVT